MRNAGIVVAKARNKLDRSQEFVARRIGTHSQVVSDLEVGRRKLSPRRINQFCKILHIERDELIEAMVQDFREELKNKCESSAAGMPL